jgi:K+-transporting ATPase ATPase A chain
MTTHDVIQILLFFALLIGLTPVLGKFMAKVFTGEKHFMQPIFGWLEKLTYKFIKVNPDEESNWKSYTFGMLLFNLIGLIFVFLIQILQSHLPMNPAKLPNVSWDSALNTAVSFMN